MVLLFRLILLQLCFPQLQIGRHVFALEHCYETRAHYLMLHEEYVHVHGWVEHRRYVQHNQKADLKRTIINIV